MSLRTEPDYINEQKKHIDKLAAEAAFGVIKRDTLPNTAYNRSGNEAQAMYFKYQRDFLETVFIKRVMDAHQDIYGGESRAGNI